MNCLISLSSVLLVEMIAVVTELLERGASINLYMFHGGTSFGFMSGAVDFGTYKPQTSSYGTLLLLLLTYAFVLHIIYFDIIYFFKT